MITNPFRFSAFSVLVDEGALNQVFSVWEAQKHVTFREKPEVWTWKGRSAQGCGQRSRQLSRSARCV